MDDRDDRAVAGNGASGLIQKHIHFFLCFKKASAFSDSLFSSPAAFKRGERDAAVDIPENEPFRRGGEEVAHAGLCVEESRQPVRIHFISADGSECGNDTAHHIPEKSGCGNFIDKKPIFCMNL